MEECSGQRPGSGGGGCRGKMKQALDVSEQHLASRGGRGAGEVRVQSFRALAVVRTLDFT